MDNFRWLLETENSKWALVFRQPLLTKLHDVRHKDKAEHFLFSLHGSVKEISNQHHFNY